MHLSTGRLSAGKHQGRKYWTPPGLQGLVRVAERSVILFVFGSILRIGGKGVSRHVLTHNFEGTLLLFFPQDKDFTLGGGRAGNDKVFARPANHLPIPTPFRGIAFGAVRPLGRSLARRAGHAANSFVDVRPQQSIHRQEPQPTGRLPGRNAYTHTLHTCWFVLFPPHTSST